MGLLILTRFVKKKSLFFIIFLLVQGLYAQTQNVRIFFSEEIENIEKKLKTNISLNERRLVLTRRAQLFQLSGNIEGAAQAWMDLVSADRQNYGALIEGAFCFFAIGEMEKADTNIKTVLSSSRDRELLNKARYLNAQIEAFQNNSFSSLVELSRDSAYEKYRPAIYYTLWRLSDIEGYKNQLISEYPSSPEALIVRDLSSNRIAVLPSAMWIFFPGRGNLIIENDGAEKTPVALQTGVFSREENAQKFALELKTAGFEAAVNLSDEGESNWLVIVQVGSDANQTINMLKDKGFDFLPIFPH